MTASPLTGSAAKVIQLLLTQCNTVSGYRRGNNFSGVTGLLITLPNLFLINYFQFLAKLTSARTPKPVAPRRMCGGCVCGYSDVVPTLSSTIPAMSQCAQG